MSAKTYIKLIVNILLIATIFGLVYFRRQYTDAPPPDPNNHQDPNTRTEPLLPVEDNNANLPKLEELLSCQIQNVMHASISKIHHDTNYSHRT